MPLTHDILLGRGCQLEQLHAQVPAPDRACGVPPSQTCVALRVCTRSGGGTALQTARYPDSPNCVEPAPAAEGQPDLRLAPCDRSDSQLFFLVAPEGAWHAVCVLGAGTTIHEGLHMHEGNACSSRTGGPRAVQVSLEWGNARMF